MSDRKQPSPSHILRRRFAAEALLSAISSPTGAQLESLRTGAPPEFERQSREAWADDCLLCKGLTPEEEQVARLRYGPQPDPSKTTVDNCRVSGQQPGNIEQHEHWETSWNVPDAMEHKGELPIAQDPKNHDLIQMQGVRARWLSYEEIASRMQPLYPRSPAWSAWVVRKTIEEAMAKVRKAQEARAGNSEAKRWEMFMGLIEERYE